MNANPTNRRLILDAERQDQLRDAVRVDIREDQTLIAQLNSHFATAFPPRVPGVFPAPATAMDFLDDFRTVNALVDSWVVGVYPTMAEQDIARTEIMNACVGIVKEELRNHGTEYEGKLSGYESTVNTTVAALRAARDVIRKQYANINPASDVNAAGALTLPTFEYDAALDALDIDRDILMGDRPTAGGVTLNSLADIQTHVIAPTNTALRNLVTALNALDIQYPAGATADQRAIIQSAINAVSAIAGVDSSVNSSLDQLRQTARNTLRTHNNVPLTITDLKNTPTIMQRLSTRIHRPDLNEVADETERYRNVIIEETGATGHSVEPNALYFPQRTPIGNGYVRGRMMTVHDLGRFSTWALNNRTGDTMSADLKHAMDQKGENIALYHVDHTEIQNRLNTILTVAGIPPAQSGPSSFKAYGPQAVEQYINDYAFFNPGVQGFAANDDMRDAMLNMLAWHFNIAPGNDMNQKIYQRITDNMIAELDHVTDKKERKEISDDMLDNYADFYQRTFVRPSRRREARRNVFLSRREEIYGNLAEEYENKQLTSSEVQKKLKADLVKEVMKARFAVIEKIADQREVDDEAGIFRRLGGKFKGISRKLAANPVKRLLANIAVGGGAVAAGAFLVSNPVSAAGLALSGLAGLSTRGALMATGDLSRAKLTAARGNRSVNQQSTTRNAATGVRGPVNVRNARRAQKSLLKQISLAHDVDADFDLNKKGEFSIHSDTYTGQLERSTALWQSEAQQVENIVQAEITAALSARPQRNATDVLASSLSQLYRNGGTEDVFMHRLERRMKNAKRWTNLKRLGALTAGIAIVF